MNFWKDYFIDSKISNYQDYTKKKYWLLCEELIELFSIDKQDKLVDRWCATWNLVKEFVERWYTNIKWSDISTWAIQYAKENWLSDYVENYNKELLSENNDYIIINDVLEHLTENELNDLLIRCNGNIILRVPVCANEWEDYVLECSRVDRTHIIRRTKEQWINKFKEYWYNIGEIFGKQIYTSEWVLAVILTKWE